MAVIDTIFGKLRGRVGNLVFYEDGAGRTVMRKRGGKRGPSKKEGQKRQNVVFGTLTGHGGWMQEVIRLGFPGRGGWQGSFGRFTRANTRGVVTTEPLNPGRPLSRRRKAMDEFRGVVDYAWLKVSEGALAVPVGSVEVDKEERLVRFRSEGQPVEAVDCYSDDRVYGVVLCPSRYVCQVVEIGSRGTGGEAEVTLPAKVKKSKKSDCMCYLFAVRADGLEASDSVCVYDGTKVSGEKEGQSLKG